MCTSLSFILTLLSFSLCTIAPAHPCHFLPSWRNHSFSSWNNPSLGCPYTFGLTDPGRGWTSAMWSWKPAQPMNLRLQALQPPKVPTLKILHWIQQQLGGGRRKPLPSVTEDRELRCHTKIRSSGPEEEELKKPVQALGWSRELGKWLTQDKGWGQACQLGKQSLWKLLS